MPFSRYPETLKKIMNTLFQKLLRACLVCCAICATLTPAAADNITVNGTLRSYNVIVPKNLGEKRPLFIFCHGYNQDANWMQNSEFKNDNVSMEAVCDTAKFVMVFPNGINKSWDISGNSDINFVKAIIEKMVTQHKIDRNRVYLGGFSMGGMFTYHAMNRIPDLIAAFVPVSGYPMGGATANANVRPIPILHIHGTGDETCGFSGVQPALNVWIKHNGCPTTAQVVNNYNGFNCKMRTWGPGNDGVYVKLLELAGKGHWICKEPQVYTGKEMWNFCKNYSLEMNEPQVRITSPQGSLSFLTFGGASQIGDITIEATASDPDGTIKKVEFYDNDVLIATTNKEPYSATVSGLKAGKHTLSVVATDNEGLKGQAQTVVTLEEPTSNYVYSKVFDTAGSVPTGWATYDGNERRVGYSDGYSSGCRVFQFTGNPHAFDWGLYARNVNGGERAGYARFADPQTSTTMMLHPGNYTLYYRLANWNCADFSPVTIAIEAVEEGSAEHSVPDQWGYRTVYETTVTPTVNVGNSAENAFSGVATENFSFDVYEFGRYQITFYTADAPWADLVVGVTALRYKGAPTGIEEMELLNGHGLNTDSNHSVYDLQGRKFVNGKVANPTLTKGLYIINGQKHIIK
jgi:poly(3-hydroxybutyrate) depolymerase